MVSKKIRIHNPTGLHLRPAGNLCEKASNYKSRILIRRENTEANAKSLLSILGACIKYGDEVEFICEGKDEKEALDAMITMVECGLEE